MSDNYVQPEYLCHVTHQSSLFFRHAAVATARCRRVVVVGCACLELLVEVVNLLVLLSQQRMRKLGHGRGVGTLSQTAHLVLKHAREQTIVRIRDVIYVRIIQ